MVTPIQEEDWTQVDMGSEEKRNADAIEPRTSPLMRSNLSSGSGSGGRGTVEVSLSSQRGQVQNGYKKQTDGPVNSTGKRFRETSQTGLKSNGFHVESQFAGAIMGGQPPGLGNSCRPVRTMMGRFRMSMYPSITSSRSPFGSYMCSG